MGKANLKIILARGDSRTAGGTVYPGPKQISAAEFYKTRGVRAGKRRAAYRRWILHKGC